MRRWSLYRPPPAADSTCPSLIPLTISPECIAPPPKPRRGRCRLKQHWPAQPDTCPDTETTASCAPPCATCATDAAPVARPGLRAVNRTRADSWAASVPTVPKGLRRLEPSRTGSHVPAAYVKATKKIIRRGKEVEVEDKDAPMDRWAPLPEPPAPGSIRTMGEDVGLDWPTEHLAAATWAAGLTQVGLIEVLNSGRTRHLIEPWTVWQCSTKAGERLEFGPAEVFQLWRAVATTGELPKGMQPDVARRARMVLEAPRLIAFDKAASTWRLYRPECPAPPRYVPSRYAALKAALNEVCNEGLVKLKAARRKVRAMFWRYARRYEGTLEAAAEQAEAGKMPTLTQATVAYRRRFLGAWSAWKRLESRYGHLAPPMPPWSKPPGHPRPDRRLPQAELFQGKSSHRRRKNSTRGKGEKIA